MQIAVPTSILLFTLSCETKCSFFELVAPWAENFVPEALLIQIQKKEEEMGGCIVVYITMIAMFLFVFARQKK